MTMFFEESEGSAGSAAPAVGSTAAARATAALPRISVRLFAGAAAAYGADQVQVSARTLQEAVEALAAGASPDAVRVIERSSLLLNAVACTDRDRELTDGDRVDVLPPFAGG